MGVRCIHAAATVAC